MSTYEQSPLDPVAARAARDAGIAQITEARQRDFEYVTGLAKRLLSRYRKVTADDVRGTMRMEGGSITHENVVGAAFNTLARQGYCTHVGYAQSKAKKARGRTIKVWSRSDLTEKEG